MIPTLDQRVRWQGGDRNDEATSAKVSEESRRMTERMAARFKCLSNVVAFADMCDRFWQRQRTQAAAQPRDRP